MRKRRIITCVAAASLAFMAGCAPSFLNLSRSSLESRNPTVAFDSADNAVIAWSEGSTFEVDPSEILVKYWNGDAWIPLQGSAHGGGISNNSSTVSRNPALAVGGSLNLVVAWEDSPPGAAAAIYLKKWDGTSWSEFPTGSSSTSAAGYGVSMSKLHCESPVLLMDGSGNAMVLWSANASTPGIFGTRWDGAAWADIPGADSDGRLSPPSVDASAGSAALNKAGHVALAYQVLSDGVHYISVQEWTGSGWKDYDLSPWAPGSLGTGQKPVLAMANGTMPVVAWEDDRSGLSMVYVAYWDDLTNVWKPYGPSLAVSVNKGSTHAWEPALALDSAGRPVVAWKESWSEGTPSLVHSLAHARRWNGTAWESITAVSHDQVSNTLNGEVFDIAIALDSQDVPIVVWGEGSFDPKTATGSPEDIQLYWPQ